MTEEDKNDKYIICSKCRSKCTNDEEHIYIYIYICWVYNIRNEM